MRIFTVCLIIAILLVLGYVWQHIEIISTGYRIEGLKAEKTALVNKNKEFQVQLSSLKSLDRIEKIAKDELHLIVPVNFVVLNLDEETSSRGNKGSANVIDALKEKFQPKERARTKFDEIFKIVKKTPN